jgi:hypothetical protein
MGKLRRGGYIFIWWKADHPPRHVHLYRDGKLVVKWDLDNLSAAKAATKAAFHRRDAEFSEIGIS